MDSYTTYFSCCLSVSTSSLRHLDLLSLRRVVIDAPTIPRIASILRYDLASTLIIIYTTTLAHHGNLA